MSEQFSGLVQVRDTSDRTTISLDANTARVSIGTSGNEGDLIIRDGAGRAVFNFDSTGSSLSIGANGNEGDLIVRDSGGRAVFNFDSNVAALYIGANGNEGDLQIRDGGGRTVFNFNSSNAALYIGANGNEGDLQIRDGAGRTVFNFNSSNAALYLGTSGNEGDLILRDSSGNDSIHLDGGSGDIILRNADTAEHFDVVDMATSEPGTVMVLNHDGKLEPCLSHYDKKVVGVVSGAGNYRPGIVLGHKSELSARTAISVLGKVSCKADTAYGAIEVGDLLTTSPTPGHAMKASDPQRAFGAIIGKALSNLNKGTGLVDLLITLQ